MPCRRLEKNYEKKSRVCFFLVGNVLSIYDRNSTDWIKKVCLFPSISEEKSYIKAEKFSFFLVGDDSNTSEDLSTIIVCMP